MKSLLDRCDDFLKIAGIVVQKNNDTVLKELSSLKSFDERIKFAKEHWDFLGEGSSRTAFQMNSDLIIKIAHNDKGIAQVKTEMDPKAQRECTNPVILADAQGKWLIMRNTEKLTEKEFKNIVGFSFDTFMDALFYKFNNESDKWKPPQKYEEIERSKLFQCLSELVFQTDQQIGDLAKLSSWRNLDGKVVLVDFGLNRSVFLEYYKSDSGSSSSTPPKTSS